MDYIVAVMENITLYTERLQMRLVNEHDLQAVHSLHSLPETDQYNTLGIPASMEVTAKVLEQWMASPVAEDMKSYIFAIEQLDGNAFTGLIAIVHGSPKFKNAEIWYKLMPAYWNKGYATEAVKRVIAFGFHTLGLHRIEAGCAIDNAGSVRTLEKAGMTREGCKRQALPLKTGWADCYEFAILSTDPF